MLILGIDTATPWGTIALSEDGGIIFELTLRIGKGSSEHLLTLLQQVWPKTGRKPEELDLIAAGVGPGSYTGIRIGLAAAAGLAEGLQIPVYGVNTLRLIAENARYGTEPPHMVAVAVDARRAEVYAALYAVTPADGWREVLAPQTLPAVKFATELGQYQKILLCGDGGKHYREAFETVTGLRLAPEEWDRPRAGLATEIARREWSTRRGTLDRNMAPDYLRKVEAEIRLEAKLRGAKNSPDVCGGPGGGNCH
jgi:tRNA threonylcarbamoyladenosine biosynthesis protein TsaB